MIANVAKKPPTFSVFAIRLGTATVLIAIAIVALRNKKPALWIIGAYLMLSAIGAFLQLIIVSLHYGQVSMDMIYIAIVAVCFAVAAWILIESAMEKAKNAEPGGAANSAETAAS